MKNETLYNKTVDILVQAYFNDTLEHGTPCGCAIGNLVLANCRYLRPGQKGFTGVDLPYSADWFYSVLRPENKHKTYLQDFNHGMTQIQSTGYSVPQVYAIERAFETAKYGIGKSDYMFNGLMAVIDALDIIHENTDTQTTVSTKKKFIKSLS